jgi:hypothetical protein
MWLACICPSDNRPDFGDIASGFRSRYRTIAPLSSGAARQRDPGRREIGSSEGNVAIFHYQFCSSCDDRNNGPVIHIISAVEKGLRCFRKILLIQFHISV